MLRTLAVTMLQPFLTDISGIKRKRANYSPFLSNFEVTPKSWGPRFFFLVKSNKRSSQPIFYFSVLSLSSISPLTTTGLKKHPRYQVQAFPAQQLVIPPSKPPGF
jgi:hypothetical protein